MEAVTEDSNTNIDADSITNDDSWTHFVQFFALGKYPLENPRWLVVLSKRKLNPPPPLWLQKQHP